MKERGTGRASGGGGAAGPGPLDPAGGATRTPDPGKNGDATGGGAYQLFKRQRRLKSF